MAWPTSPGFTTANVDAPGDNPSVARVDIKDAMDDLTDVINGRGQASGVASLDGTSKVPTGQLPVIPLANLPVLPIASGLVAWNAPGTYSWTVPAGVTRLIAHCWGGGGGGGWTVSGTHGGGGGAAGGAIKVWTVTPGDTVNIVVGAGGQGGQIGGSSMDGQDGAASTVTIGGTSITGHPGFGGLAVGSTAGGIGGHGQNGDLTLGGGTAGSGITSTMGGIGGSNAVAGSAPNVNAWGGGGGYGSGNGGNHASDGLHGLVYIYW
ncbi:MAG: hypothetical protein ACKVW3_13040 [Phycisphaerales bacterium]